MKRFILPAMFIVALAGSAFTRYSRTASSDYIGYYEDKFGNCQSFDISDYNCIMDALNYPCYEDVGIGTPQLMLQYEFGNTCYQPYYSYYPNFPGYGD